jgi:hypothetical protein
MLGTSWPLMAVLLVRHRALGRGRPDDNVDVLFKNRSMGYR